MKVVTYEEKRERMFQTLTGAVIVLICLVFFLFTPSKTIRFITLIPVLVLILSFVYSHILRKSLVIFKDDSVIRGHRHEKMKAVLYLANQSVLPTPHLVIHDETGHLFSPNFGRFIMNFGPKEQQELSYEITGHNRGEYFLGPVELSGSDPLGLFPWRKTFDEKIRVIIYPRAYPLELIANKGLPVGSIKSENKIYEDVTQFRSIREYMPGDEMKRVNWKASARMGKLYSMEFLPTLYFPVIIFLNLSSDDYPLKHRDKLLERACELAVSFVFYFVNLKLEVGLITTGALREDETDQKISAVEIKSGYNHALRLLEIVSSAAMRRGSADFQTGFYRSGIKLPARSRILVISPALKASQGDTLLRLNSSSHHIEYFEITERTQRKNEYVLGNIRSYTVPDYGEELINEK